MEENLSTTKQLKSGAVKHVEHRKIEDHINEQFTTTDGKHGWLGQELEAQSDPLIDSGTGKAIVMRFFEFEANPVTFKKLNPSNQELFNSHAQQIKLFLWKDGLEPYEAIEPRIIRDKKGYKIMVTCTPKAGVALNDKTFTLQELAKK